MAAAPPRERTVVEGNLAEHPIWKLNNRQARPTRRTVDKATGKVLLDPATGAPREYVDPADYTQVFDLGPSPADPRVRRQLVMKADVHAGFPTASRPTASRMPTSLPTCGTRSTNSNGRSRREGNPGQGWSRRRRATFPARYWYRSARALPLG